jgi:hypothetical protein
MDESCMKFELPSASRLVSTYRSFCDIVAMDDSLIVVLPVIRKSEESVVFSRDVRDATEDSSNNVLPVKEYREESTTDTFRA